VANQAQWIADADHSVAFWTSVATTFKTYPAVRFDLFNEPAIQFGGNTQVGSTGVYSASDADGACWKNGCTLPLAAPANWATAGMQQMLNAVRTAGATQPVLVGGLFYAQDMSKWLQNVPTDLQQPSQIVAKFHSYCGPPGTSTVAACQAQIDGGLQSLIWPGIVTIAQSYPW
jgi:hypothetical protein